MPLVTFDELVAAPFRRFRWGVRSSGTYLPETIADALEDLWEERIADAMRRPTGLTFATGEKNPRRGRKPAG